MHKHLYLFYSIFAICFLSACGVKKIMVEMENPVVTEGATPVLGLLWQSDTLHVTLNHGVRLQTARVKKDTLYLYESQKDTSDIATRQYALHLPEQELFVIKYNDTLVYPVMPSAEGCEYPLDIKSVGAKNTIKYNEIIQENLETQRKKWIVGRCI